MSRGEIKKLVMRILGKDISRRRNRMGKGFEKQNLIMQHTVDVLEGKVEGLSFRQSLKGHNMPEQ